MYDTIPLVARYRALKEANPKLRVRDAAEQLGISEGELIAARADDRDICRLTPETTGFSALLEGLREVGRVMTLTRNQSAVHETYGTFDQTGFTGTMGQVVGPIQLRLFFEHWHAGFAVTDDLQSGRRHSFQVFDQAGDAVIKIYAVDETDKAAWGALRDRLSSSDEAPATFPGPVARKPERSDAEINQEILREDWKTLDEIHSFFNLLRKSGVRREQAFRLAGPKFAYQTDPDVLRPMLDKAAADGIPVMCFVGSRGCVQIQGGPIHRIVEMGPWLNILDPDFNLHLRADHIARAWVVTRPTQMDGRIASVEFFNEEGTLLCQFFGLRGPGQQQPEAWWNLVDGLPGKSE